MSNPTSKASRASDLGDCCRRYLVDYYRKRNTDHLEPQSCRNRQSRDISKHYPGRCNPHNSPTMKAAAGLVNILCFYMLLHSPSYRSSRFIED
jgi:hypothetical protein